MHLDIKVLVTIDVCSAVDWDLEQDQGRVPLHQGHQELLIEVAGDLLLLPASGQGEHPPKSGDGLLSLVLPHPQSFPRKGEEGETLVHAGLVILPHLLVESEGEGRRG